MEAANVGQALECLICHDRQWRALGEPCGVVEWLFLFQWLLHKQAILVGKPFSHFKSLFLGFPTLVGIHIELDVGANAAHQFIEVLVFFNAAQTHFHLNQLEVVGFGHFLANHLIGVDTDGASGERRLFWIQTPDFVPRLSHELTEKVVQSNVDASLCSTVVGCHAFHIRQDVFFAEWVGELLKIEAAEEFAHAFHAFAEIWRHRAFTIAHHAVVFQFHLHIRCGGAAVFSKIEGVLQLQFVREEFQFQSSASFDLCRSVVLTKERDWRCSSSDSKTCTQNEFSTVN